jgi:hypothetical protein
MKRILLILFAVVAALHANAQMTQPVLYKTNCNKPECVRCDTPARIKDGVNLTRHFEDKIDTTAINKFKGIITVKATADAAGNLCARSFAVENSENTAGDVHALKLDYLVSKLPAMQAALKNGKPVSSEVTLVFIINLNMQRFYVSAY